MFFSVGDAADLYLSLKHPAIVFINDTPCGFVRHVEYREPSTAQKLWGSTAGCFERPSLEKDPDGVRNFFIPGNFLWWGLWVWRWRQQGNTIILLVGHGFL